MNSDVIERPILTAPQFSDLLNRVRDVHADVRGCRSEERANELRHLRTICNEMCNARLARHNDALIERRRELIKHTNETLSQYREDGSLIVGDA